MLTVGLFGALVIQPVQAQSTVPSNASTQDESPSKRAKSSGQRVEVLEKRTETSQTFANPDGSFTLEQHSLPVRMKRGNEWLDMDATLEKGADGRVRPRATALDMTFSGGGSGPLIAVKAEGHELTLTWPEALPEPVLVGDSVTYPNVYPDVDLKITASSDSYSEVLIVKTLEAARLPEVQNVDLAVDAPGLTVAKAAGGVIEAKDDLGKTIFLAPQPIMWDSRGEAVAPTDDDRTEAPLEGDQVAQLPISVTQDTLTIRPAASLVEDPATEYPLHIDPTLRFGQEGRAMINARYPTTSSWNWEGPEGVGYQAFEPWSRKRLFYKMRLGDLGGTQILGATFSAYETWAASCDEKEVQIWQTTAVGTGVNWNNGTQAGVWKRKLDSVVDAVGRNECTPNGKYLEFDVKAAVAEEVAAGKSFVYLGLRAANESDEMAWKRFRKDVLFVIDFNHIPRLANARTTQPTMGCQTDYQKAPTINQRQPIPHLNILDPDGQSSYVKFDIWRNGFKEPFQTIRSVAKTATSTTDYTPDARINPIPPGELVGWKAQATDGVTWTPYTGMCWFRIDIHKPGKPEVVIPTGSGDDIVYDVNQTISAEAIPSAADTNYFKYSVDALEPTSEPVAVQTVNGRSIGKFSFTPRLTGPAVVRVWSYDRAGNQSDGFAEARVKVKTGPAGGIWRMNEGSGTSLADSSGKNRTITLGAASWGAGEKWSPELGVNDWAVRLNPSSTAASTATDIVDTSRSFTASVRVKLANTPGRQIALSENRAGTSGFVLGVQSQDLSDPESPKAVWEFTMPHPSGTGLMTVVSTPTPYLAGSWVYLTGRYDSGRHAMTLFVNETAYGVENPADPLPPTKDYPGALRLGFGTVGGSNFPLDGHVDDGRVYPHPVEDATVRTDMGDS
ncbi:LamG domain-containing protein [Kribbella sandramycini]|uniref:LamG domain-containing protein n=1 Tax=Kribbella sandramycini TaxID=60450 RepID=A0A7Y4L3W8_9ACTN|nr:hypothetical protein [Kribbella sandramycini]NOL43855.1 LamG domain-containing protein [Kribbella sandramycini]